MKHNANDKDLPTLDIFYREDMLTLADTFRAPDGRRRFLQRT